MCSCLQGICIYLVLFFFLVFFSISSSVLPILCFVDPLAPRILIFPTLKANIHGWGAAC